MPIISKYLILKELIPTDKIVFMISKINLKYRTVCIKLIELTLQILSLQIVY